MVDGKVWIARLQDVPDTMPNIGIRFHLEDNYFLFPSLKWNSGWCAWAAAVITLLLVRVKRGWDVTVFGSMDILFVMDTLLFGMHLSELL